ncbi:MAG: adenylyl-sulfate kinase [Thermoplasmata archaeon]
MPGDGDGGAPGFIVWVEGLPGAGKSTMARALSQKLSAAGWKVEVLDGDELRGTFFPELTFSRKDREAHARRVSQFARILARNGVVVIAAMITPYETSRQTVRANVGSRFVEVWVRCPLEICQRRDPKGIYSRRGQGSLQKVTGVDDPFEEPLSPDVIVDTASTPVDRGVAQVLEYLDKKGLTGGRTVETVAYPF